MINWNPLLFYNVRSTALSAELWNLRLFHHRQVSVIARTLAYPVFLGVILYIGCSQHYMNPLAQIEEVIKT